MKRTYIFKQNPALVIGLTLLWLGIMGTNVLELEGLLNNLSHLACGAGTGLSFVGLLYSSKRIKPLFERFHAFKLRLAGHNKDN